MGDVREAGLRSALELDHVLIAVDDLADAARDLDARYGLSAVPGGRHPGWGTANVIVPLGDAFLELVAVVDEAEAAESAFGRWVAAGAAAGGGPLGWVVRPRGLDAVARRLGLRVSDGSRETPAGERLQWRTAGIGEAAAEPSLPFFIEWGNRTPFPGHATAAHPAGAVSFARLELSGDPDRLTAWLGDDHTLPIAVSEGEPAVTRIVVAGPGRETVID